MSLLELVAYWYLGIVVVSLGWLWWACRNAPMAQEGEE